MSNEALWSPEQKSVDLEFDVLEPYFRESSRRPFRTTIFGRHGVKDPENGKLTFGGKRDALRFGRMLRATPTHLNLFSSSHSRAFITAAAVGRGKDGRDATSVIKYSELSFEAASEPKAERAGLLTALSQEQHCALLMHGAKGLSGFALQREVARATRRFIDCWLRFDNPHNVEGMKHPESVARGMARIMHAQQRATEVYDDKPVVNFNGTHELHIAAFIKYFVKGHNAESGDEALKDVDITPFTLVGIHEFKDQSIQGGVRYEVTLKGRSYAFNEDVFREFTALEQAGCAHSNRVSGTVAQIRMTGVGVFFADLFSRVSDRLAL